jgi:hypothetical protein
MCTMRTCTVAILVAMVEFSGVTDGTAQNLCRPALTLSEVQFSPIRTPKL